MKDDFECPYCGKEYEDYGDYGDYGDHDYGESTVECDCNEEFRLTKESVPTYSTSKNDLVMREPNLLEQRLAWMK